MQRRFVLSHVGAGTGLFFLTPALLASGEWGRGIAPIIAILGCAAVGLALVLIKTGRPNVLRAISVMGSTLAVGGLAWLFGGISSVWPALIVVPMLEASNARSEGLDRLAGLAALTVLASLTLASPTWLSFIWLLLVMTVALQISRSRRNFYALQAEADRVVAEQNHLLDTFERTTLTLDENGLIARMLGTKVDLDISRPLIEAVHRDDRSLFSNVLNGRDDHANLRLLVDEGEWRSFQVKGHHKAEAQLRVLSFEERQAVVPPICEKTHVERQLLATMSHEMRTPLNAIIGFSDVLEKGLLGSVLPEQEREYVSLIRESGEHLLDIVKATLDASRLEAGKYELSLSSFDFSKVANTCHRMLLPAADEAGLSLICDTKGLHFPIQADERACRQALINLLSNAIKFTPAGGCVTVKLRSDSQFLHLTVSDSGMGIAADDIARLGQPYLQLENGTNRAMAGSGLGLSVVKGFVALHGGTMNISSELGQGTDVTVTLPLHQNHRRSREKAGRIVPASPRCLHHSQASNGVKTSLSSLA